MIPSGSWRGLLHSKFKLEHFDNTELIANHVDSLLRDIYLYSLTNDDHVDDQLLEKVETLENLQFRVEPEITPYLHVIYKHATLKEKK